LYQLDGFGREKGAPVFPEFLSLNVYFLCKSFYLTDNIDGNIMAKDVDFAAGRLWLLAV